MNLAIAIAIAAEGFKNKTDKAGEPYILHCLRVMNTVSNMGKSAMIIGVLHDLLEDTNWTKEQLLKEGFEWDDICCIDDLTHKKGEDYLNVYIKRIAENPYCRAVKLADLKDNSDITRLKGLTKKDFDRMEKYHTAYTYLSKI